MSSKDAQIKKHLKIAKKCLADQEHEDCLDEVKEILELDKDNYFAYIFGGKAYHSLKDISKSIKFYRNAIDLQPESIHAWKGLYLVLKSVDDFEQFFDFLEKYIKILQDQREPLHDLVKDISVYHKKFNHNAADQNAYACYLKALLPNTNLGEAIGFRIQPYEKTAEKLLKLYQNAEEKRIKEAKRKYPLTMSIDQQTKFNKDLYKIYSTSEIPKLYNLVINFTRDDEVRYQYEEADLKYTYNLIKTVSDEHKKDSMTNKLMDDVKGMVTVRHPAQLAWELYFDFVCANAEFLEQLDLDELCWYVSHFEKDKGLQKVIYAFLLSDISPFSAKAVSSKLQEYTGTKEHKTQTRDQMEEDKELEELEDQDKAGALVLSNDEILTYLETGLNNSNKSFFASRLAISYYIHTKEYLAASERTRLAVRTLASISRETCIKLPLYRRFLLLSLATIYTYFEAPKNFTKALELYEKIDQEDPGNSTVMVGKGFIMIEKGELELAKDLLKKAVSEARNRDAEIELAWCRIKTEEIEEGRLSLQTMLTQYTSSDAQTLEKRAMMLWRIGESYLLEAQKADQDSSELIKKAYDNFINSLKQSSSYAPSYTSLGFIYQNFYDDIAKAVKCYFKAFELDGSDLAASKALATHYADLQEWRMCEVICSRVLSIDSAKRKFMMSGEADSSWAYRILGICYLESQEYAKSVELFQNAIRINKLDTVSWSCLGEAYLAGGRYEAALKVYEYCAKLRQEGNTDQKEGTSWYNQYMLASVHSQVGNFSITNTLLEDLKCQEISARPLTKLYCHNLALQAQSYHQHGFIGRAIDSASRVVDTIHFHRKDADFINSQLVWKHLGDVLLIFLHSQGSLNKLELAKLQEIITVNLSNQFIGSLDEVVFNEDDPVQSVLKALITCSHIAVDLLPNKCNRDLRSSVYYNLGICYLNGYDLSSNKQESYLNNAVLCFKKAIQAQDKEPASWTGMGIAAFYKDDSALAQHSIIRSLTLAPKDPQVWTILAILYLKYNDLELAKETFMRVHSLAPESNAGWIGNAVLHELLGDTDQAAKYFTHGFVLSNGRSSAAQLLYTHSIVQKILGSPVDKGNLDAAEELNVANFAILNYLEKFPTDVLALNLALTVVERLGDYEKGTLLAEKLCMILENAYESSENHKVLIGFARANSSLGRLQLGNGNYQDASDKAQVSLDMIEEDEEGASGEVIELVLSNRAIIGLSLFFEGEFEKSLEQFKLILAHLQAQDDSRMAESLFILISQVLYTKNTEETIQAATDELFTYIEQYGSSLLVAFTLGAISLVKNIEDILPAVKADLMSLNLNFLVGDSQRQIPKFISEIDKRLGDTGEQDHFFDQRIAFMFPNDTRVWKRLNKSTSLTVASVSGQVSSAELAQSCIENKKLRQVQRALFLDPSSVQGLQTLAGCF